MSASSVRTAVAPRTSDPQPLDGIPLSKLAVVTDLGAPAVGPLNHVLAPTELTEHTPRVVGRVADLVAQRGPPTGDVAEVAWANSTPISGTIVRPDTEKALPDTQAFGVVQGAMVYATTPTRAQQDMLLNRLDRAGTDAFVDLLGKQMRQQDPEVWKPFLHTQTVDGSHATPLVDGTPTLTVPMVQRYMARPEQHIDPRFQDAVNQVLPTIAQYAATREAIGQVGPVLQGKPAHWEAAYQDDRLFRRGTAGSVLAEPDPASIQRTSAAMDGLPIERLHDAYATTRTQRDLSAVAGLSRVHDSLEAGRRAVGMAILRREPDFRATVSEDTKAYGLTPAPLATTLGQAQAPTARSTSRRSVEGPEL